jgi:hypothetical protein
LCDKYHFNFAPATAIAAARLIPLAQSSIHSKTAGSIDTLMGHFFPSRLIDFLPSGA